MTIWPKGGRVEGERSARQNKQGISDITLYSINVSTSRVVSMCFPLIPPGHSVCMPVTVYRQTNVCLSLFEVLGGVTGVGGMKLLTGYEQHRKHINAAGGIGSV